MDLNVVLEGEEQTPINDDSVVLEIPKASTHEVKALEAGWKPLEEWEGNPEDWVDAKTFNQRGEYMDRIKSQSSLIKKLEKKQSRLEQDLKTLAEHHRKVQEVERKKALDELKQLKRQALDMGDTDRVVDIDDQIDDIKRQQVVSIQQQTEDTPELHPDVSDWIEENQWYESDAALRGAANAILEDLVARNPELKGQVAKSLKMMKEQLQEEFPNKFKKRTSAVVDSSSNADSVKSAKASASRNLVSKLTEEHKQYAKRFIQQGAVKSMEEYAKQLHDIGEI